MLTTDSVFLRSGLGLAVVAFLCGPALAQQPTPIAKAAPAQMKLILKFPSTVNINLMPPIKNNGAVVVPVGLSLINGSRSGATLKESNACVTHTWTVSEANGQNVDSHTICNMIFLPVSLQIGAGKTFTAQEQVALDGSKYHDGGEYTLHYRFWGVDGAASFKTTVTH